MPGNASDTATSASKSGLDKDRLSRALGAAFLQHQVSELEKNVSETSQQQQQQWSRGRGGGRGRGDANRGSGQRKLFDPQTDAIPTVPTSGARGRGRGRGVAPVVLMKREKNPQDIKVVDVSMLCHALPLVKEWCREGTFKLVVPLDVLSSLDILKNSPLPLKNSVREATRFLDTRLASMSATSHLICQGTTQECSWQEVEKMFVAPITEIDIPKPSTSAEEELSVEEEETLSASDCPKRLRSVLQCLMWYHLNPDSSGNSKPSPSLVLYVDADDALGKSTSVVTGLQNVDISEPTRSRPDAVDYDTLSSGATLAEWAPRFGISVTAVSSHDVEESRSRYRAVHESQRAEDGKWRRGRPLA